jgi:hypothetical protein
MLREENSDVILELNGAAELHHYQVSTITLIKRWLLLNCNCLLAEFDENSDI